MIPDNCTDKGLLYCWLALVTFASFCLVVFCFVLLLVSPNRAHTAVTVARCMCRKLA